MDYFSELLESYTKLKKRTFKLTYINEAEEKKEGKEEPTTDAATTAKAQETADAAIADAPEISSEEIAAKGLKVKNVVGEPTNMIIYKNVKTGAVGVQGLGPQGGILSIDKNVGTSTAPKLERNQEAYDEFVKKLSGESDLSQTSKDSLEQDEETAETEAAEAQQAEADRLTRLGTLGSLIDMDPERFPNAQEIKALEQKNKDQLDSLCELDRLPKHICANDRSMTQYIGGSRALSLESKLVNGTGQVINADGKLERTQIDSDTIKDVFDINLQLLQEMGKGDPSCEFVGKRIGMVGKGKVVIFTNPDREDTAKAEGIVFPKTGLLKGIVDGLASCQNDEGIKQHNYSGGTNSLNETKGRFNELFMGVMCQIYSTARGWRGQNLTPEQKSAELATVLDRLKSQMAEQEAELLDFAGQTPLSEQGVDLESFPLMEEIDNQINTLQNPEQVRNVLQQMMIQMATLVKQVEADDIIPAGTAQRLGGKVDNYFLYVGPDSLERASSRAKYVGLKPGDAVSTTPAQLYAEASPAKQEAVAGALERQGLSIDDDTTPIATLSIGNKMSVGNTVKFGDLSLNRALVIAMGDPITGPSQPEDEQAYYAKLHTSLGMDPTQQAATKTYMEPIQAEAKRCSLLSQGATYVSEDGEIKLTDPEHDATTAGGISVAKFTYGAKGSAFYSACTKQIPNPNGDDPKTVTVQADFQDPKVQKYMTESLQRDFLARQFAQDLDGDDPVAAQGARDSLCMIAGSTIMEMSEMGQIVTQEKGSENPDYNPDLPAGPDNVEYLDDQETIILNQNDVLRAIGEARKNPLWKPAMSGSTITFDLEVNGKKIQYSMNMERQHGNAAFSGKMSKENADAAGKRVRRLSRGTGTSKPENQDTMYSYLKGQVSLLETLLQQYN
tara:strand:- start:2677 stop:5370 length:2694 start_codon:yes stop_codon:yes gene_type:complete